MAYIGNTVQNQGFIPAVDYFNGDGSTVAFTLSRPVASVAQVQAVIENVPQNPGDAYTVSGNTITFTSAPPSGTNNIYVYYTSPITQVIQPGQGTVGTAQIQDSAITTAKIAAEAVVEADLANSAVTTVKIANAAVTPAKLSQPLTSGTAVTASGTSVDFTGIPSWAKKITVLFSGVSTNGTSDILVQLSTGGVFTTSGYVGGAWYHNTSAISAGGQTTGLSIVNSVAAASAYNGRAVFSKLSDTVWIGNATVTTSAGLGGGGDTSITMSGAVDGIRITTAGGTNTFDAGSINILYE
jgi:hypothetical protein